MTAGIYKIENNINHKIYIGCSKNIENRGYHHQNEAFNSAQVQYNYTIHRAFRKYGIKNFTFVILEEIEDERTRFEREKYWILYYDSYKNGYNETEGGDTGPSLKGELNFHAKLTQQEVLNIRQRVYKLEPAGNIYQDYKDKISYSAFKKIIQGRTGKTVFPEAVIVGQSDEYHFINKSAGSKRAWPSSKINPNYNNKK